MNIHRHHIPKLLIVAAAATSLALGAASAASATTEPPTDTAAATGTDAAPPAEGSAATDVSAFCDAAVAAVAAGQSGDPAQMGPAFDALSAAAPEEISSAVNDIIANGEAGPGDPAFDEPYAAMIDYVRANCGFAELNVALSEYAFGGIPEEVSAGPTILTAEATGEEVHEIIIVRINDDVTLTLDELLALPEEESNTMVTEFGGMFGIFPGTSQSTLLDFTPGRYVALCFFPEGATPEMFEQMMAAEAAAEGSIPTGSLAEGSAPTGSAPTGTEHEDMTTEPATSDTATMETATGGSTPAEGSAPAGEEPRAHYQLGMIQEFTVV
jgi:hypothetical protein